jgi:hypothetical protein
MTSTVDIVNRALQTIGTRTTVTAAELANETTNEAIQANLILENMRDDLLRMAPWDCALKTANLTYITSVPGTPENTSPATQLWTPGQPAPPWAYEYQYPVDCLRACYIIPANQTGFSGGIPITTAVTGGASAFWQGPPVRFKVQVDEFFPVTAAAVVAGGSGYAVGDVITLPIGPTTSAPIGAPVQLRVDSVGVGNAVATVSVVNVINGSATPLGGSYFAIQTGTIEQDTTTGSGTGASFTLTQSSTKGTQRVILTNQEFATLGYVKQVIDPNVMDTLFQTAWVNLLASGLCMALRGDKTLANSLIQEVNLAIESARAVDGNEGLTINDVTSDWIRVRGVAWDDGYMSGPYSSFDWGGMWPAYF